MQGVVMERISSIDAAESRVASRDRYVVEHDPTAALPRHPLSLDRDLLRGVGDEPAPKRVPSEVALDAGRGCASTHNPRYSQRSSRVCVASRADQRSVPGIRRADDLELPFERSDGAELSTWEAEASSTAGGADPTRWT